MKKLNLILLLICVSVLSVYAKSVGYNADGGFTTVTFSILKTDSASYIVINLESSNELFFDISNPEVKVRFFNGDVITLYGVSQGQNVKTTVIPTQNFAYSHSSNVSIAKFPVSKEQIEKFPLGVQKIRISTLPKIHEKEFKKDKFGVNLYKQYLKTETTPEF